MSYKFANYEQLDFLLKQKKAVELVEEFQKTEMVELNDHHHICLSAKEQYCAICEYLYQVDKKSLKVINAKAIELFAEVWDAEALLMIRASSTKFGILSEKAKKVLAEYESYKKMAIAEFNKLPRGAYFEKDVKGVKIRLRTGRLSFLKDGREFVIFYSEDL